MKTNALSRLWSGVADGLGLLLVLTGLAWILDLPRTLGFMLYTEQYLLVILGLALALTFLTGVNRKARLPSALRHCLALLGVAGPLVLTFYAATNYEDLMLSSAMLAPATIVVGVLMTTAVIGAVYFAAGIFLSLVICAFILLAHVAGDLPQAIQGRSVSFERIFAYLSVDSTAIIGMPISIASTTVFAFILFGVFISRLGGGEFFADLAMRSVGRYRGGSAKAAVVGSAFFGSVSGSAVANIVATGVITIPLMRKAGYRPDQAAATEAVASTGGQLLPPIMGAAAFLMAEFLQISYGTVLMHALIPALLYYCAVLFYVDLVAGRDGIQAIDDFSDTGGHLLRRALVYLPPFVVLLVAMFWLQQTPEMAALAALATLIVLRCLPIVPGATLPSLRQLFGGLVETGHAMTSIIVITAAAGAVIGLVNISGSAFTLSVVLINLGGSSLFAVLLVTAAISIVLGMGMPTAGVYVLLATLAAPAMIKLGVEPVSAHLFVLYFGLMSMLTPPVAVASYVAATMANASPLRTSIEALRLGWVAFVVPFLFVYSPSLLLIGTPWMIGLTVVTAFAGVWLIAAAIVGFGLTAMSLLERALILLSGLAMLAPLSLFPHAEFVNLAGALLAGLLLWRQRVGSVSLTLPGKTGEVEG